MRTKISLTISTILFHTIRANRKVARKTMKQFSVFNNPLVQKENCLFEYEYFVTLL